MHAVVPLCRLTSDSSGALLMMTVYIISSFDSVVVGFHLDLLRMVPTATTCDHVGHGTNTLLGWHLLTPT